MYVCLCTSIDGWMDARKDGEEEKEERGWEGGREGGRERNTDNLEGAHSGVLELACTVL